MPLRSPVPQKSNKEARQLNAFLAALFPAHDQYQLAPVSHPKKFQDDDRQNHLALYRSEAQILAHQ